MYRLFLVVLLLGWIACGTVGSWGQNPHAPTDSKPRSYRMGFSITPPRPDVNLALQGLEIWTKRSDAAIIHQNVPWKALLAGTDPKTLIAEDPLKLVQVYRSKHFAIALTIEPLDGLNRSVEAAELLATGRSIGEVEVAGYTSAM